MQPPSKLQEAILKVGIEKWIYRLVSAKNINKAKVWKAMGRWKTRAPVLVPGQK